MKRNVNNLTTAALACQRIDAGDSPREPIRPALLAIAALVLALATGSDGHAAVSWQPAADIEAAAEAFLRDRTGARGKRTTVRAAALDPRHRLPRCDAALEAFMRRGAEIGARTVVGVRCTGSRPWKVYVPVDVVVTAPVVTARRTLPRGHLIGVDDLAVVDRDVSRMQRGYFSEPADVAGLRVRQQLIAGSVLTPAAVEADQVVRRGQSVTLVAVAGGVSISMAGTALTDGALNQRIRVENTHSGRVVEGIVRSPEHVEVLVSASGGFFHSGPKEPPAGADTGLTNNER
ncbi:MAG: flagellar basal body P-ring formation chaperone FlgA [Woeseiaceae bacterium]|nr:flagellar basal body P-ring formation chaperone FlgA [Woeseiaceae bacterium]